MGKSKVKSKAKSKGAVKVKSKASTAAKPRLKPAPKRAGRSPGPEARATPPAPKPRPARGRAGSPVEKPKPRAAPRPAAAPPPAPASPPAPPVETPPVRVEPAPPVKPESAPPVKVESAPPAPAEPPPPAKVQPAAAPAPAPAPAPPKPEPAPAPAVRPSKPAPKPPARPKVDAARIAALDKRYLWHPFTAMADWLAGQPLVIVAGEGPYLIDAEGKRYLDGVSSLWCNLHGHRHPTIDAAVREQLDRVAHTTMLGLTHPPAAELAEQLVRRAPTGLARVFYSDSGATACEVAAKIAFHYWQLLGQPGRTRFLSFSRGYHGDTIGMVSLGGIDLFTQTYRPLLSEPIQAPPAYCYRCPLGKTYPACGLACVEEVDRLLGEHAGEVAAVFVEPLVQGAGGIIVSPPGYLRRLREITLARDVLLVADEVAVGFGRTGALFACQQEKVSPDLLCLGKGISGGYLPLAATLVSEAVFAPFARSGAVFHHGHTYTGNPLAAAAGLASLRVFDAEKVIEKLPPKIEQMAEHLGRLRKHFNVGDIRQRGLIGGIELVANRESKRAFEPERRIGAAVCQAARAHGLVLRPLGDVLVIMPPLCITVRQIDELFDAVEAAMADVLG